MQGLNFMIEYVLYAILVRFVDADFASSGVLPGWSLLISSRRDCWWAVLLFLRFALLFTLLGVCCLLAQRRTAEQWSRFHTHTTFTLTTTSDRVIYLRSDKYYHYTAYDRGAGRRDPVHSRLNVRQLK